MSVQSSYINIKRNITFKGFTFIELLVAISILVMLLGVGTAGLRGYQRRQVLDAAVRQVVSDLRLTQQYAISGKKEDWKDNSGNTICNTLEGYALQWKKNTQDYYISAVCDQSTKKCKDNFGNFLQQQLCVKTVTLPQGIKFSSTGPAHKEIIFKSLAQMLTATDNMVITDNTSTKTISISQNGKISY